MEGVMHLPKMDGVEIRPGVVLIGEPMPEVGKTTMRCLANVYGVLCVIELKLKFIGK